MKKLLYIVSVLFLAFACQNTDIEFPDFDFNAVYFPQQYPVRTLILGNDRGDNSMDKELRFHIGTSIGGMYENPKDWSVNYVVDNTLADRLTNQNGDTIRVLPTSYYTITPAGTITIPAGSFDGLVEVQLTDAFLDDPEALKGTYVIPLRITTSDADSVLHGFPYVPNPNRNNPADWSPNALPKDYTLFGITYINPYHGVYLHRGVDVRYDATGSTPLDTVVFRQKDVEKDQLISLATTGRSSCVSNGVGNDVGNANNMSLSVDVNGNVTISSVASSPKQVTGSGRWVADGGSWGGEAYDALYLEYQYMNAGSLHIVKDTLVFRNNDVTYRTNTVTVY